MPTTLLLDGPDLEALLLRARREGGPNARITRAEKVRRGGVMGFFAHEVFEVAVDVPDGYVPQPEPNQDGAQPALGRRPEAAALTASAGSGLAAASASATGTGDPFDAVVKAIAAMGAQDTLGSDLPALNAVGVSDTAARVRTAQRAATARAYSAGSGHAAPVDGSTTDAASSGFAATTLLDRLEGRGPDGHATDTHPAGTNPAGTHPAGPWAADTWPTEGRTASVPSQRQPVMHELAADPVQPSTQQPAFTALLDQLRRETLPPAPSTVRGEATVRDQPSVRDQELAVREDQPDAPLPHSVADARIAAAFSPLVSSITASADEPADQPAGDHVTDNVAPAEAAPEQQATASSAKPATRRPSDPQLKADRQVLRALGVPSKLTRRLRSGDRFDAVLSMCRAIPELDVDGDAPIIAVVGPSRSACFEAHRVAIDLATESTPRPILTLPEPSAEHRHTVLEASRRLDHAVVVVSTADEDTDAASPAAEPLDAVLLDRARADLRAVRAQVVVAVVDARLPVKQTRAWLAALGRVDAIAVENAAHVEDPARVLEFDLPVVRLDGVSMDPLGWTALLCARLSTATDNS